MGPDVPSLCADGLSGGPAAPEPCARNDPSGLHPNSLGTVSDAQSAEPATKTRKHETGTVPSTGSCAVSSVTVLHSKGACMNYGRLVAAALAATVADAVYGFLVYGA